MAAPLSVSANVRDLNLNLNDSCNCCCFSRRRPVKPDTHVYVNAAGEAVIFDPNKAQDERESLAKAVVNLQDTIKDMAESRQQDHEEVMRAVHKEVGPLSPLTPKPITLDMLRRIQIVVDDIPSSPHKGKTGFKATHITLSSELSSST